MKYTLELEIDKPIDQVVSLFNSAENLSKWMEGLESYEHLSGDPGKKGAKAKLKFKTKKRSMEMVETIISSDLPKKFSATYEANGVLNIQKNKFEKVSDSKTKYITENEFQMKGFMNVIGFLMPGAFKKQSMKYMKAFKSFAESN